MIAVDTNILLYAHRYEDPKHKKAVNKLETLAEGKEPWAIPVFCIVEFLRVITHPKLSTIAYRLSDGIKALNVLRESPTLSILYPSDNFTSIFLDLLVEGDCRGNLVFDAQVAALCLENGISKILTDDRDFERFKQIKSVRL